jgi:hypothetical protein
MIGSTPAYILTLLCTCRYGSWSSWGEWGRCSQSCFGGTRDRKHACLYFNPAMHMQVQELVLMGRMGALQPELFRRHQG